jgi:aspartyl-tRNA(Asn)/glutamyl-tRNA(Gln) amidotransferase subunit C
VAEHVAPRLARRMSDPTERRLTRADVAHVAASDPHDRSLTRADVAHVAMLARLALTDDEIDLYTADLAGILGHAEDVASLDTTGVLPTAHPLPLVNVFRADVVRPSLDRAEVLAAAPAAQSDRFRVPRILGEG